MVCLKNQGYQPRGTLGSPWENGKYEEVVEVISQDYIRVLLKIFKTSTCDPVVAGFCGYAACIGRGFAAVSVTFLWVQVLSLHAERKPRGSKHPKLQD